MMLYQLLIMVAVAATVVPEEPVETGMGQLVMVVIEAIMVIRALTVIRASMVKAEALVLVEKTQPQA